MKVLAYSEHYLLNMPQNKITDDNWDLWYYFDEDDHIHLREVPLVRVPEPCIRSELDKAEDLRLLDLMGW